MRRVAVGGLDDNVDLATLAAEGVTAEADASVGEAFAVIFSYRPYNITDCNFEKVLNFAPLVIKL